MDELPAPETYFFGERWDAPAFDDSIERPTPVGEACGFCEETVEQGDSGTWQVFILSEKEAKSCPIHIECWLRQGLGSPAHLRGECSCTGVPEPQDDRSWRDQGREVMRMIREHEGTIFGRLRA